MLEKHCNDESLLSFLDGEVSRFVKSRIRRHLESCWVCRTRLADLEQQIYVLTRKANESSPEDTVWTVKQKARLSQRIREYERESSDQPHSLLVLTRAAIPMAVAALVIITIVLGGMFVFHTGAKRTATSRIEQEIKASEMRFGREALHQQYEIEVRQTAPIQRRRAGLLQVWSTPGQEKYASQLVSADGELQYALWQPDKGRSYHYDKLRLTTPESGSRSAASQMIWETVLDTASLDGLESGLVRWFESRHWQPLSLLSDTLSFASEDGYFAEFVSDKSQPDCTRYRMRLQRGKQQFVVEILLRVSGKGYKPVWQHLWMTSEKGSYDVVLRTKALETVSPAQVNTAVLELNNSMLHPAQKMNPVNRVAESAKTKPQFAPGKAESAEALRKLEMEVLYALHRAGACRSEPIEVVRNDLKGELTVRGRVSGERKTAVEEALAPVRTSLLQIKLTTEAEAAQTDSLLTGRKFQSYGTTSSESFALKQRIEEYLRQDGSGGMTGAGLQERVNALANRLFLDATESLAEAWALRRLADRYPEREIGQLSLPEKWLLETMVRDHLNALGEKTTSLRALLLPMFRDVEPRAFPRDNDTEVDTDEWSTKARTLFQKAQNLSNSVISQFAGSSSDVTQEHSFEHLTAALQEEAATEKSFRDELASGLTGPSKVAGLGRE